MYVEKSIKYLEELTKGIDAKKEPGFCSAVIENGKLLHTINHGLASLEHNSPLTNNSLFYLASVSKQFTAACILKLVHDKKLKLSQDVRSIVKQTEQLPHKITIKNLLNHTSGIADYFEYFNVQLGRHPSDYFDNNHILEVISKFQDLEFMPNEYFEYSNSNYIVLAQVAKVISSVSLAKYAKKHLFKPVGMNQTIFDEDRYKVIKNRVSGYVPQSNSRDMYRLDLKNSCTVGDGGVLSSINDPIKWELNFYKNQALDAPILKRLTKQHYLKNSDGKLVYYGNGLELPSPKSNPKHSYHGGGFDGFSTFLIRVPTKKTSVIFLANNEDLQFGDVG